ncbi:retrovirus-related pol polyprotein from transposon TNT 1-94 [Tanacetum coccineum]
MDIKWQQLITHEITVLVNNLLIPLAIKTKANSNEFKRALKQEMFEDSEYVQSLEKEFDELEFEMAEFSHEYDLLLQECVLMCSFDNLHEYSEMACNYLEAIAKCESNLSNASSSSKSFADRTNHPIHRMVRFGNDQFALILGYGDLVQGNIMIKRLSHLNFNLLSKKDIVNGLPKLKYVKDQLCLSCEMGKAKRSTFKKKVVPSSKGWLHLLHMDLCGPMWIESINGKKYIMVIVDEYSRYTWTYFLRSKDETPEVL